MDLGPPEVLAAVGVERPEVLAHGGKPFSVILEKVGEAIQEVDQFSTPAPAVATGAFKVSQKSLSMVAMNRSVHE